MKHLSKASGDVTKKIFQKKYILLGRLLGHWEDIIGTQFALSCSPAKLSYRKNPKNPKKPFAVLCIAVSSAHATLLHYQKDVILQRINQVFGETLITDIKFVPIKSNENAELRKPLTTKKAVLSEKDRSAIAQSLHSLEDTDIKSRLQNLGEYIFNS